MLTWGVRYLKSLQITRSWNFKVNSSIKNVNLLIVLMRLYDLTVLQTGPSSRRLSISV